MGSNKVFFKIPKFEIPWGWLTAVALTLFFGAWGYDNYLTNKQTHAGDGKPYVGSLGETRVPFDGERIVYMEYNAPPAEGDSFKEISIRNDGFWKLVIGTASSDSDTYRIYKNGQVEKRMNCYLLTNVVSVCSDIVQVGQVSPVNGEISVDSLRGLVPEQHLRFMVLGQAALSGQGSLSASGR